MPLIDFTIPASPEAVGMVRRTVVPLLVLSLGLTEEEGENLELMLSELVTNGYLHGCRKRQGHDLGIWVAVADGGRLRVEVTDPALPAVRVQGKRLAWEGGRGLLIISRLAADHGSERDWEAGTRISWFEMDIAALRPVDKDQEEESTAAGSSSDPEPVRPVNTVALAARIADARPAVTVGTIGARPITAAA
ncbi:hypothetical protein GCM10009665_06360 [Kitasatospora nipponensis]|uniref:Histidine kinase/HSP90-like ATPase domain-containing protein n=1 Tax=Kitasatospora nipponensis TaxID=258049 RepID=A0ABP4GDA5_9ACTN